MKLINNYKKKTMKLIITKKQLRLIIESEQEDNLMDLTAVYNDGEGLPLNKLDNYFLYIKNKRKTNYDGYYIDGNIDLRKGDDIPLERRFMDDVDDDFFDDEEEENDSPFTLNHLVKISGYMDIRKTNINGLDSLKYVGGYLNLNDTNISNLSNLEQVGGGLGLINTNVKDLPELKKLKGVLSVKGSPIMEKNKLEDLINRFGKKVDYKSS